MDPRESARRILQEHKKFEDQRVDREFERVRSGVDARLKLEEEERIHAERMQQRLDRVGVLDLFSALKKEKTGWDSGWEIRKGIFGNEDIVVKLISEQEFSGTQSYNSGVEVVIKEDGTVIVNGRRVGSGGSLEELVIRGLRDPKYLGSSYAYSPSSR